MCAVCGNGKCEKFETCTNCSKDCGQCETIGCFQVVTCALKCFNLQQDPPQISATCLAQCVALGCSDVQFFVDQVLNCAIFKFADGTCNEPDCVLEACKNEVAVCLGATCPDDTVPD